MPSLRVSLGQCTDKGCKPLNQDFHGLVAPIDPLLGTKGVAMAIADGISSSDVSQVASELSVKGFLDDYYATPETWSVKNSVHRVLQAVNSWLYAQTRQGRHRYEMDRGYVCTFSAVVFRSNTAHIFHVGDARVYAVVGQRLEQLTEDHRRWLSRDKSYLSRALGMQDLLDIDYLGIPVAVGDTFVLATDGVYEFVSEGRIAKTIARHAGDLDLAARRILDEALANGSDDNLTIQVVRVEELPAHDAEDVHRHAVNLPFPPELRPRMEFDGYRIVRELHHSSRSHVYLAEDIESGRQVALKTPSVDLREDQAYLERFLLEEWVARRIDNVHVLKYLPHARKRNYLYTIAEYIEGQGMNQWMIDNPEPDLETVRGIVAQIANGLQAMHRREMIHQDLRPHNVLIDRTGTVKLIDFGSVRVTGLDGVAGDAAGPILGTAQYTAPEYFLCEPGTPRSDLYSLGAITYQMLSGRLPYGTRVARSTTRSAQRRLVYDSVLDDERTIPSWVDAAIRKAVHPDPYKRYEEVAEFIEDLRRPNRAFVHKGRAPLLERNPLMFWKGLSLALFLCVVYVAATHPLFNR